jgi:hypothetical protein
MANIAQESWILTHRILDFHILTPKEPRVFLLKIASNSPFW